MIYEGKGMVNLKNGGLSSWIPSGWLRLTFTCARNFIAEPARLAVAVGKKGQGEIKKVYFIGLDTQFMADMLGSKRTGQFALIHIQEAIWKEGKTRKRESLFSRTSKCIFLERLV